MALYDRMAKDGKAVTSKTTYADEMPALRPINMYAGITPMSANWRPADDTWSTADGLFRKKPMTLSYETPATVERSNPFYDEVMAMEAAQRTPKVAADKMDALLTALQVLTDNMNSGCSGDRVDALGTSYSRRDDQRDAQYGIPRA